MASEAQARVNVHPALQRRRGWSEVMSGTLPGVLLGVTPYLCPLTPSLAASIAGATQAGFSAGGYFLLGRLEFWVCFCFCFVFADTARRHAADSAG